jgi:hypothetical protein
MDYSLSDPAAAAFIAIPVLLVIALLWGTFAAWRRSGATPGESTRACVVTGTMAVVWMAATWAAAASGVLRNWDRVPPPFAVLVLAIVALSIAIAFSSLGKRLAHVVPLWALVGIQAFRLPLELAMHEMYERGIMPEQMSYSGRNFDILTGMTAIVVAVALRTGRGGRGLATAWNVLGLALVLNVVIVAVVSTPAFRYFGDERLNVWVTYPPYVWLPAVMVPAAVAGHLVVFRALSPSPPPFRSPE